MIISKTVSSVRGEIKAVKGLKTIGFVPTMGALHQGHIRLVRESVKVCSYTVVSIFVNPTQFGPKEDYSTYPRKLKEDLSLLSKEKVDLVFVPSAGQLYKKNFSVSVIDSALSNKLCGKTRPGHFNGVLTVVAKLFNIVLPDLVFFGQKDYQQALIIKKMIEDLNFPISLTTVATVRQKDGLALSSRNAKLTDSGSRDALAIYESLSIAKSLIGQGERDPVKVIAAMRNKIKTKKSITIDYLEIVSPDTLEKIRVINGKILIAVAVYVESVRLIDNLIIRAKA
ncbi:MAG: pantoate--beta-alanine ligase [Candidatus Omnitrophica bacterium]|nr:pantoate--beta-alanine ligase [Candidatus Omnitrophota bacterium]